MAIRVHNISIWIAFFIKDVYLYFLHISGFRIIIDKIEIKKLTYICLKY